MALKMLLCFNNISHENLLHILGYSFCADHHILVDFCQKLLPLTVLKIIYAKAALL